MYVNINSKLDVDAVNIYSYSSKTLLVQMINSESYEKFKNFDDNAINVELIKEKKLKLSFLPKLTENFTVETIIGGKESTSN